MWLSARMTASRKSSSPWGSAERVGLARSNSRRDGACWASPAFGGKIGQDRPIRGIRRRSRPYQKHGEPILVGFGGRDFPRTDRRSPACRAGFARSSCRPNANLLAGERAGEVARPIAADERRLAPSTNVVIEKSTCSRRERVFPKSARREDRPCRFRSRRTRFSGGAPAHRRP